MAHRFHDPAPPTPNDPTAFGGHDHHHRFLRRLSGAQVRSASRPEGHLDRTTALAGFCYRANSHRRNQSNLCGMMWVETPAQLAAWIEGVSPEEILDDWPRTKTGALTTAAPVLKLHRDLPG